MHDVYPCNRSFLSKEKTQVIDTFEFVSVPPWQDPSFLSKKYLKEGLNPAQIAAETFSCQRNVTKQLKRFGIPLRSEDTRKIKSLSQLKFGESLRRKRVAKSKKERAVLQMIMKLRAREYSFHKIARVLNDSGIPTKTGRGKWHARFVQRLLMRKAQ